ncbi:MAG: hypothetical protein QOE77_962 [Blastocatellia bacterium]|jgi:hypothetical protein|nr:hypothetical protein [Blastocatellia bacterium]
MKIVIEGMSTKLSLALMVFLLTQIVLAPQNYRVNGGAGAFRADSNSGNRISQQDQLIFPGMLKKEALEAGNPLATYAAMIDLESQYRESKIFAGIYPEIRFNFEEFLGVPLAGVQALSLSSFRRKTPSVETPIPASYEPESALKVIEREAGKTHLLVYGEEHHLPQTRSLYEPLLRMLWRQGYRYLAAEAFDDKVMGPDFKYPDYQSGFYLFDPVFASAVRVAKDMGYKLIAYDTKESGPRGDDSFRDRTQAENIKARTFDLDPRAKVFVIAGRGHASEETAQDGWTPMASVLKRLTGINPLTLYAPKMSQRMTAEEEDPLYRFATSRGLVKTPTIFVDKSEGHLLGASSFDAYVFWPRIKLADGRPDWMRQVLGRKRVRIPSRLLSGSGMRLVQAFREGDREWAIPVDQVIITQPSDRKVLMVPAGRYWLRTIDRNSQVIAEAHLSVR